MQRGAVNVRQPQTERLAVQMRLKSLMLTGEVGRIGIAIVQVVFARGSIVAPLAVIGRRLDAAVALPAFFKLGLG